MKYSRSTVIHVDIRDFSVALLSEFREFLRLSMITPITKGMEGANVVSKEGDVLKERLAFYSGCFTVLSAEKIEKWLREKGVELVEMQER